MYNFNSIFITSTKLQNSITSRKNFEFVYYFNRKRQINNTISYFSKHKTKNSWANEWLESRIWKKCFRCLLSRNFSIFQNFIKTTASSLYNLSNLPAMHTNTPVRGDWSRFALSYSLCSFWESPTCWFCSCPSSDTFFCWIPNRTNSSSIRSFAR